MHRAPAPRFRPRSSFPARLRALVVGGLISAFLLPAGAAAAAPTPTGHGRAATFGVGPASAEGVDGRSYLNFLATPGAVLTDHLAIVNLARTPATLNVYAVDAVTALDGSFGYQPRAVKPVDAGSWVAVTTPGHQATVTLKGRQTLVLPLRVSVPRDASPGDHAAGVIVSLTSKVKNSKGEDINFEQRVALRTLLRVSGDIRPALSIEGLTARYDGGADPIGSGTVTVRYTVHNTGNVSLGARQKVAVSGLLGTSGPTKALADIPLLLPGSSVRLTAHLSGVRPQGHLTARVTLYPLTVAGDVDPGLPKQFTATTGLWAIPWAFGTVVIAALAIVALALWLRRRRRAAAAISGPRHTHRPSVGAPS